MTAWLEDNGPFPGNAEAFKQMKAVIAKGNAVAFVGAGASAPIYPLWTQFLENFVDRTVVEGLDPARAGELRALLHRPLYVAQELLRANEEIFYTYIAEAFGADRPRPIQTKTHEVLMSLPFLAYVTTNYDAGLAEARATKHPGLPSYNDMSAHQLEAEDRWRGAGAAAFVSKKKEILHLHGRFNEREGIVLTLKQYQLAYGMRCKRILRSLWERRGLVLVGYGFTDPWIKFIAQGALAGFVGNAHHFALIGVNEGSFEDRGYFRSTYGAEPVFYPVRERDDHSALLETLNALGPYGFSPKPSPIAPPPRKLVRDTSAEPDFPEEYAHPTTDDAHYVGRKDVLARLDGFVGAPEVRVVAVTGIGGLGKTSLIGYWLKRRRGHLAHRVEGIFYWSFYVKRSFETFADALLAFAERKFGWTLESARDSEEISVDTSLLSFLRVHPLCLVLDGLEVIQGDRGTERYGMFLDQNFAKLLTGLANKQTGLTLLTSRFPFADLNRFRGLGFVEVQLPRLSPEEGAALLTDLDMRAEQGTLEEASHLMQGHALALRILAATAHRGDGSLPDLSLLPDFLGADRFSQKMEHILGFYADKLTNAERKVIGLVALFPSVVPQTVLTTLTENLDDPDLPKGLALDSTLAALKGDGLLLSEPRANAWSAHPIVRDHFRSEGGGAAEIAADLVAGRPAAKRVTNIEEIRGAIDAIAILCDAGDFAAAWSLYQSHCGGGSIFIQLRSARIGYEVESRFIVEKASSQLSRRQRARALDHAAIRAQLLGNLVNASELADRAALMNEEDQDWSFAAINRMNRSDMLSFYCPAVDAVKEAEQAYALANKSKDAQQIANSRARLGLRLVEAGYLAAGAGHVSAAYEGARRHHHVFYSGLGVFREDIGRALFIVGRTSLAASLFAELEEVRSRSDEGNYPGWSERWATAALGSATDRIAMARKNMEIVRLGGDVLNLIEDLIEISLALVELNDPRRAENEVRQAIEMAAARGIPRLHSESLGALAAAFTALGEIDAARTAAEDALALIRPLGYVSVERLAWRALVTVGRFLKDTHLEAQARNEVARIDALLVWPKNVAFPGLGHLQESE